MATQQLEVVCPDGVGEGQLITVHDPSGGSFEVVVPAGVSAGQPFLVELTVDAYMTELQGTVDMDAGSAAALRAVLQALHDDEALDESPCDSNPRNRLAAPGLDLHVGLKGDRLARQAFVDEHSHKFATYVEDGEQQLEWGSLHLQYVALVERTLESALEGSSADSVYALLEAHSANARGQRFLNKFLSMGDYRQFCAMMSSWDKLETVKAQCEYIDAEQAAIDDL